jgi:CO/xanthine dehydrogenase FAD-binding subunit
MGDRPLRATAAEQALQGSTLDAASIARAAEVVADGMAPITDAIASAWYRKEVLPVHFRRLMTTYL